MATPDPLMIIEALNQLAKRAQEADHFENMATGLVAHNQDQQILLHRICNIIGSYIVQNGPLEVAMGVALQGEKRFELYTQPMEDRLGRVLLCASPITGDTPVIRPDDNVLLFRTD